MSVGNKEKEILALTAQLSEELISNNYKAAYGTAGTLHAKMKGDTIIQLPIDVIEGIRSQLRFYYKHNEEYNTVSRKMYGTGKKLAELAEKF
ncbi:hypothetical protein [Streptococcus suis]|nr:hypothetical protein [Streptococcus suis]